MPATRRMRLSGTAEAKPSWTCTSTLESSAMRSWCPFVGRGAVPGPSNLTSGDSRLFLKDSDTAEERGEPRVAVGERGCHARRCRQVQPDLGGSDAADLDVRTRVKEGGNQFIADAPGVAPFGGRQRHVVGDLEGLFEVVEEAGFFFRLRLHGRHLRFTFPVPAADLAVGDPHGLDSLHSSELPVHVAPQARGDRP